MESSTFKQMPPFVRTCRWRTARISIIGALAVVCVQAASVAAHESNLSLDSSDARLVHAFDWAKRQALAYAFTGDPVGSWYEASLPGREAFCMRDVSHQAVGAHALGLAAHTANMLRRFAENISDSKDWCSYWEINRYNRPAPVDYQNDGAFWYCLPANYDVLDACYRMYLWSGDPIYTADPVFLNFYDRTVTDYEQRWGLDSEHVMHRKRLMNVRGDFSPADKFQFFRGIPSYQESDQGFVLGVDLLATQYAAYLAYAGLADTRGDERSANQYIERAAAVKALINNTWWNSKARQFYSILSKNYQLEGLDVSAVLYSDAAEDGPKLQNAVANLIEQIKRVPSIAVEEESHNPEILYRYGAYDLAYSQIMDLTREDRDRREYPEVSYSVVGAIVTGLIGVRVEPASSALSQIGNFVDRTILTLSGLGPVSWAELRHLPVRDNEITIRHEGTGKTLFTNEKGPSLIWRAAFPGTIATLEVNGKRIPAHAEKAPNNREISYVDLPVAPDTTARVELPK